MRRRKRQRKKLARRWLERLISNESFLERERAALLRMVNAPPAPWRNEDILAPSNRIYSLGFRRVEFDNVNYGTIVVRSRDEVKP